MGCVWELKLIEDKQRAPRVFDCFEDHVEQLEGRLVVVGFLERKLVPFITSIHAIDKSLTIQFIKAICFELLEFQNHTYL